jgi:hypothetical protein
MGLGERMRGLATSAQDSARETSLSLLHIFLRLTSGAVLGLVLALIGKEMIGYGALSLFFVITVVLGLTFKTLSNWSIGQVLIFDLICILVGMLLRMYILVAP